ncbi:hypothetical protein [Listeria booriae]|uniref:hypothetical protein n=1 Tax=Listeria booriae TaxID=1552123 RepID=UPI001627684B|nr:hypothetical protein [Listeria booriae]MBC2188703.1 hypothetical protein [Listeria booriae]
MFQRLLCRHDYEIIKAAEWEPFELYAENRTVEEVRKIKVKCAKCGKTKTSQQRSSNGKIIN